jgi:hypothetical protein
MSHRDRARARRRLLALVLAVVVALVLAVVVVAVTPLQLTRRHDPVAAPVPAPGPGPQAAALRVLHGWDAERADAWARGSLQRLAALYLPGSGAGRADVRLLGRYRARGYVVAGMRTQVLALDVLEHRPGRWTVRVTDRLAAAVAIREGAAPQVLPRDRSSRRVVTLLSAGDGRWRVGSVLDAATPAPR